PHGQAYIDQLRFLDGLLDRLAATIDPATLLLVTGDHGMASRGTHGGEEEARRTPFVLRGPGVKTGIMADVPQTALASTLAVLLGLPMLPVSEYPPATNMLAMPAAAAQHLTHAYLAAKSAAAQQVASLSAADAQSLRSDPAANDRLNVALFGAADTRLRWRFL